MKRRRLYLWTFLAASIAGWAAAHFTVGNAGTVALRAVISEGRMKFSSSEKQSAAARTASLTGKSIAEQAAIIAGWWQLTSVAEIRHLYAALDKVPSDLRDEARDLLLGRWAMLDPDSLLLAALRETDNSKRIAILHAFSLHWAAGRSPDEIADMVVSVAGDVRKFIPESPAGGYFRPETALASGRFLQEQFGLDPRVLLTLAARLHMKLPPEGYVAIFSALARSSPQEARDRLAEITDPAARRAATAGVASQLALTDPAAALAMCASGDRDLISAVTPGYLKYLLSLPVAEAWQKAGEFSERYVPGNHSMILFLQRMGARDSAGLFSWMSNRPAEERQAGEFVLALGGGPVLDAQYKDYFLNASPHTAMWLANAMALFQSGSGSPGETIQWLADTNRPDLQMAAAGTMLYRLKDLHDTTTAETRQLIEMLHAAPLSPEARAKLVTDEIKDERSEGIAAAVSRQWPESAALLDGLSPAARESALPGFIRGAAAADPTRAAALLAAEPETPAAAEAAASLAKAWAVTDLRAAQQWLQSLTGERHARAESALRPALESWGLAQ